MEQRQSVNDLVQSAIDNYSDMIIRIAYQILQNAEDSEDVAQEVFIKLISHPDFNEPEHMKAWLIRVTVNLCKDYRRKFLRRRSQPAAEEWAPFSDEQQRVFDTLRSLPPRYREVIHLYYYEGYSSEEIARMVGVNASTVRTRLERARKQLKTILEGKKNE